MRNATRLNLYEMPAIARPCVPCDGRTCTNTARVGGAKERFVRHLMKLETGISSHDAFSVLFRALDPECANRAERLGSDVIAVDGRTQHRFFEGAAERLPLHVASAFSVGAPGARPGLGR